MKKLMSISLVIVLVLALGSFAFAKEGSLAGGNTLSVDIDVYAEIGPYASVREGGPVQFGTLLGKVGLYTANGFDNTDKQFYQRAAEVFGDLALATNFDEDEDNNDGWGSFYVESNTDVTVALSFDNAGWLLSPTLFAAAKEGAPDTPLAWASSNWDLTGHNPSFTHYYQPNKEVLYGIDGAIWIQQISQQEAGNYTGLITITVSK